METMLTFVPGFCLALLTGVVSLERPVVNIFDGSLVGTTMSTISGRNFSAFLGIPFAEPPVAKLRFMPPIPNSPWMNQRDAGSFPPACTQVLEVGPEAPLFLGQEDCLYVNVFTPRVPSQENPQPLLPVIFFLHFSAFMFGSSFLHGPRYLLDYDVILVTINYRLNVFGFLTTNTPELPGNVGLLDQVLGMRWVQRNIAAFGGNPDDVTLAGTSSGSASVHFHMLSPLSQGMFHRAIMQSGVGTMITSIQKQPRRKFYYMADYFGCLPNTTSAVISCLQHVPAEEIIQAMMRLQSFFYLPAMVFGPTTQYELPQAFLPDSPYELMRTGLISNVPTLISCVANEGLYPVATFANNDSALSYLNTHWNEVAPFLLDYIWSVADVNSDTTSQRIRRYYFGNKTISRETIFDLIGAASDRWFLNDIFYAARYAAHFIKHPVYMYRFGYRGATSITNFLSGTNINWGAGHPDDSFYILNSTLVSMETTPEDREMISVMVGIWGNFVTRGFPVTGNGIPLLPIDKENALSGPINYLWIDSLTHIVQNSSVFGHSRFWNELPLNEPFFGRPSNLDL